MYDVLDRCSQKVTSLRLNLQVLDIGFSALDVRLLSSCVENEVNDSPSEQ